MNYKGCMYLLSKKHIITEMYYSLRNTMNLNNFLYCTGEFDFPGKSSFSLWFLFPTTLLEINFYLLIFYGKIGSPVM